MMLDVQPRSSYSGCCSGERDGEPVSRLAPRFARISLVTRLVLGRKCPIRPRTSQLDTAGKVQDARAVGNLGPYQRGKFRGRHAVICPKSGKPSHLGALDG